MKPNWLSESIRIRGEDGNTISFTESPDRRTLIVSIENDDCTATVAINADHMREIERIRYRLDLDEPSNPED